MGSQVAGIGKVRSHIQNHMIIDHLLIIRTNGHSLCEYSRQGVPHSAKLTQIQPEKSVSSVTQKQQKPHSTLELERTNKNPQTLLQTIKMEVIEQSRKLTLNTYDNEVLHLTVEHFSVYYRAYASVLIIAVTRFEYSITLVIDVFARIVQMYTEQAKKIMRVPYLPHDYRHSYPFTKSQNESTLNLSLPSKISFYQERQFKSMSTKLAALFRELQGKNVETTVSMNQKVHSNSSSLSNMQEHLFSRQQQMNTYNNANVRNDRSSQYHKEVKNMMLVFYARKYVIFAIYGITIILWIYLILT